MTAPRHVDVGAYVLGILDEPDEASYEEHFAQCEQCRREYIELADLPAILDTMKPAKADPGPQPALPPLDSLINFRELAGERTPPGPSVPPQLRPAGATQPQRIPPTNGRQVNGPHVNGRPAATGTRHTPVTRPNRPIPRPAENTGRSAPVARPAESTGRSAPVSRRPEGTRPPGSTRPPAGPPTQAPARAAGPGGRRRRPVWLAAAVVAVLATVGVVIGVTSGGSGGGQQVADPATSTPPAPTSGAVAGAHVVSGTDPTSGVTAIITIEPVAEGTQIDVALYEVAAPQQGEVFVVSRFGDREQVATWKADGSPSVRTTGVSALPQHDISRFEIHGDGTEPLLVVPV